MAISILVISPSAFCFWEEFSSLLYSIQVKNKAEDAFKLKKSEKLEQMHNKLKKMEIEKEGRNWSYDISVHVWGLGVENWKEKYLRTRHILCGGH